MSRTLTALPADSTVATVSSATGFNAGEYVYLTSSGYTGQPTVNAGPGGAYIPGGTTGFLVPGGVVTGGGSLMFGPSNISATYTGSSITAGQTKLANTTIATTQSNTPAMCSLLSDGNIVFVYVSSGNVYFQIVTDAGVSVVAQTTVATNRNTNTFSNYTVCATSVNNRFAVFWHNSSNQTQGRVYSNSGTAVSSAVTFGESNANKVYYNSCASINGVFYQTNYNIDAGLGRFNSLTNDGVLNADSTNLPNSSGMLSGSAGMAPNVENTNQVIVQYFGASATRNTAISNGSSGNNGNMNPRSNTSQDSRCSIASYYNGSQNLICCAGSYAGAVTAQIWYGGSSYASSDGSASLGSTNSGSPFVTCTTTANGFCVQWLNSAGYRTYILGTVANGATSASWGSPVVVGNVDYTISENRPNIYLYSANGAAVFFNSSSSTSVLMQSNYTSALANGATITGTALTAPTYNLVGVALNSCAAGGSGQVLVKGSAVLNSNYQNIASAVGYDFTYGNSPVSNRGIVGGRTVTLLGNNK